MRTATNLGVKGHAELCLQYSPEISILLRKHALRYQQAQCDFLDFTLYRDLISYDCFRIDYNIIEYFSFSSSFISNLA